MNSPDIKVKKGDVFYSYINNNKHHTLATLEDEGTELIVFKYWSYHSKAWVYNVMEKYIFNWNVRYGMYYFK